MKTQRLSYLDRAALTTNPAAKKLFTVMQQKQSNLAVAADFTRASDLLAFADSVGSQICLFKTHIDILEDFTPAVITQLSELAKKHQFLIFEDRKFADIGNTVVHQYGGGMYRIADWADITNAHIVPGFGIIEGLRKVGLAKNRGLLLLAEMSAQGTMAKGHYTEKAVELAQQYADFVIGFIALRKLTEDPRFIHMTPGVQLEIGKDALGQQYLTPETVIAQGSDLIIVGRGIYTATHPAQMANVYRERAWEAYTLSL